MNSFKQKRQNEKNERIIRELMRLEENKKCFDCTSKVITYVNLSINTFICTECGGLLREINHRVKNISLSTFTTEEIKGLQNGGNKKAKAIWLAKWNNNFKEPNHNTYDMKSAKEYIRNKYIYKKWYGPAKEIDSERPVLSITIKSKSKPNSKYNLSKSFNEIEFIKKRKSSASRSSNGKSSPSYSNEFERDKRHSFHGYNPYILLDDEQENYHFDYSPSDTSPSIDVYSNNVVDNNSNLFDKNNIVSTDSVLITNHNYQDNQISNKYNSYINTNNSYSEYDSISLSNPFLNSSNNIYSKHISNIEANYSKHTLNVNTNRDKPTSTMEANYSGYTSNINPMGTTKYTSNSSKYTTNTNSKSSKKQSYENYPVYAPRSSSLLNKELIDSVYHTNDNLLIDNKKVYYYRKRSHHHSTRY